MQTKIDCVHTQYGYHFVHYCDMEEEFTVLLSYLSKRWHLDKLEDFIMQVYQKGEWKEVDPTTNPTQLDHNYLKTLCIRLDRRTAATTDGRK